MVNLVGNGYVFTQLANVEEHYNSLSNPLSSQVVTHRFFAMRLMHLTQVFFPVLSLPLVLISVMFVYTKSRHKNHKVRFLKRRVTTGHNLCSGGLRLCVWDAPIKPDLPPCLFSLCNTETVGPYITGIWNPWGFLPDAKGYFVHPDEAQGKI